MLYAIYDDQNKEWLSEPITCEIITFVNDESAENYLTAKYGKSIKNLIIYDGLLIKPLRIHNIYVSLPMECSTPKPQNKEKLEVICAN